MKKQLFGRGLVAAMENEEILAEGAQEQQPLVVPEADTMASDMLEVSDAAEEVEAVDSAIEEAVEGAEQLEEIAEIAEGSLANGGMDETSAQLMETAVESIYNRLGVVTATKMSLESFGTKGTRVQSTKLAIEGIVENAKAIWEKIIAAINSMWNSITEWFKKLFDANTKLGERAKKVAAGVVAAKGKTAKEAEVAGSFIKKLAMQGKFDSKGVAGSLLSVQDLVTKGAQATMSLSKALEAAKTGPEIVAASTGPDLKALFTEADGTKTKRLPGDLAVQLVDGKVSTGSFDEKATEVKEEKVATASESEIAEIAKNAAAVSTAVTASKKSVDEATKAVKTFTANLKRVAQAASDEATAAGMKDAQKAAPKASSLVAALVTKVNGVAVSSAGAALDYAEKSLAQYA